MRRVVLAFTVLFVCGSALAADQAVPQAPSAAMPAPPADKPADDSNLDLQKPEDDAPKAAESWWEKLVREKPDCKSFTDGCRVCSPTVCSNIGIACQPKEWTCNDANTGAGADPDAKPGPKEPEPDAKP